MLEWVFDRVTGKAEADRDARSAASRRPSAIDIEGLDVSQEDMDELLRVDTDEWRAEVPLIREHYAKFGDRLPAGAGRARSTTLGAAPGLTAGAQRRSHSRVPVVPLDDPRRPRARAGPIT